MSSIMQLLIHAIAVFVTAYVLPGVHVDGFMTAIVVAVVLAVVSIFVKPVLLLLTLPLTILTLGLFTFIINGLVILLTDAVVPGFTVDGILWAIVFSFVVSLVTSVLQGLTK
jgi:putative membrane protein